MRDRVKGFPPVHATVEGMVPYQPGKPEEELARELGLNRIVKLASNENPLGCSPRARAAAAASLESVNRYPDGGAFELKKSLSEQLGVSPSMVVLGNGSNDLLEILAQLFVGEGRETLYAWPAFVVYRLSTLGYGGKPVEVPLTPDFRHDLPAMAARAGKRTRLAYVTNPNNPTGTWVTKGELDAFLQALPPHVLPVLDEAYFEYALDEEDFPDGVEMVKAGRKVVSLRTFSKAYGLAGLRVGYGILPEEVAGLVERVRQPFNVSRPAQAAALAALEDQGFVRRAVELNARERARLGGEMEGMGLFVVPSAANFILVGFGGLSGKEIYHALLREGAIVRPMDPYGLPHHLRVSVGTVEENDFFLAALRKVLALEKFARGREGAAEG